MSSTSFDFDWIPKRLLTVREVADLCGVGERTVWDWIRDESLPVRRFGRRCTRVDPLDLRLLLEDRREVGAVTPEV